MVVIYSTKIIFILLVCVLFQIHVMDKSAGPSPKKTCSSLNPDVDFSVKNISDWENSGHLPSFGEIIGVIRGLTSKQTSASSAIWSVSHTLEQHWIDRNVYPKTYQSIERKLKRKLINKGNITEKTREMYEELRNIKDMLYDIYCGNDPLTGKERQRQMEVEFGVRMSSSEFAYLES